jgi:hypothetical protein
MFTNLRGFAKTLRRDEILSRAARGLTPCPGPRATYFRTRLRRRSDGDDSSGRDRRARRPAGVGRGALIATIGITAAFAIGIRGLVRASERWRNGNVVIGTLWATLTALAMGAAGVGS